MNFKEKAIYILKKILISIRNTFYLFYLYFKRGAGLSLFYIAMLCFIFCIVGFLLESNAKMQQFTKELNQLLPSNRVKLTIRPHIRIKEKGGGLLSLFGGKKKKTVTRRKSFITPSRLKKLKSIEGVSKITPIYSVDFPTGVEFNVPGSGSSFRAEIIGIGLPEKYSWRYLYKKTRFRYRKGKPVPVLISSYILQLFNVIIQNNGVNFKITRKNVIGLKFYVTVGSSSINPDQKLPFNETHVCEIVGFIDMDFTLGVTFPANFVSPFKRLYWKNFRRGYYDSLMVNISLKNFKETMKKIKKAGFIVQEDTQIFNKISRFIQNNQKLLSIFLKFISYIILILGLTVAFYTILWLLKGKNLEFSLYRFFGSSRLRILVLYGAYISILNIISIYLSSYILKKVFHTAGNYLLKLKEQVPIGFEKLLKADYLLNPILLPSLSYPTFIFLEVSAASLIFIYLTLLNRKL